ncbi:zinc-dependent alcohol dehydrogenase [Jeotgalibacillus soli]|uniref:Enoyl reductase (ER) domain-containing protein n=1 Tax=Jeotgalibacillus soli TaxID=889306 RepID=A0A0C2VZP9_9BACL|nr:zinc-binding alcohol dehydrogenase [Jeotgalibacillus soli]KIL49851.1 hypothetical protein KP78_13190 [Jeotgalibacillus soli]
MMKKIVAQNEKILLIDESIPAVKKGYVLVRTSYSVISPGTELSMLSISEEKTIPLGYSASGMVVEAGEGCSRFEIGQLVACYGAPYVAHSEYLLVPQTLCIPVPDEILPEEAAFVGLGTIAIHALRQADLRFGESVVVAGLGILGQLIAQIAAAAAYPVYPLEVDENRAKQFSAMTGKEVYTNSKKLNEAIAKRTGGRGVDAVLLCMGGKRSEITKNSLEWVRDKGKIVVVGDIEPSFPRNLMFGKEAEIYISRAGGPGRYDPIYEREAIDYPYGFVRWTEGRNMEEFIRLLMEKRVTVAPYIKEIKLFSQAQLAYETLLHDTNSENLLTSVFQYDEGGKIPDVI